MERIKNKEQEIAFRGTRKKKDKQIQLSRENDVFKRRIKWKNPIPDEYLFIVPWQQISYK